MSRKANKSTTIDLTSITKIYNKLHQKYSKMTPKQIEKMQQEFTDKPKIDQYHQLQSIISYCVENNSQYRKKKLDKMIKGNKMYIPTNTKSKQGCFKAYKQEKELGSGFYGTAYLASKGKNKYAVKVQDILINNIQQGKQEAEIATKMGKIGVGPKIYESYFCNHQNSLKLFIVQEYMAGGSLTDWKAQGNKFTPKLKQDLKNKVKLMHKHGIYHQDLKEDNILIQDKNGKQELFIGDFGISKTANSLTKDALFSDTQDMKYVITGQYIRIQENQIHDLVIDDMIYNKRLKFKL